MSKFKIGDRVRVARDEILDLFKPGTEGIIDSISAGYLKYHVKVNDGHTQWCPEGQLELVTEAPKRPFKVGDKVRIVKQRETLLRNSLVPNVLDSMVYTKEADDRSELPYRCISEDMEKECWCTAEQLELVAEQRLIPKTDPALSPIKPTFNVGDKVRVIEHVPLPSTLPVIWVPEMDKRFGEIGTVGHVRENGTLKVTFDDGDYWLFDPAWLTPAIEITFGGRSIADAWREAIASLCNPKKDKVNIKTKLINNNKLLTNLKLK